MALTVEMQFTLQFTDRFMLNLIDAFLGDSKDAPYLFLRKRSCVSST